MVKRWLIIISMVIGILTACGKVKMGDAEQFLLRGSFFAIRGTSDLVVTDKFSIPMFCSEITVDYDLEAGSDESFFLYAIQDTDSDLSFSNFASYDAADDTWLVLDLKDDIHTLRSGEDMGEYRLSITATDLDHYEIGLFCTGF